MHYSRCTHHAVHAYLFGIEHMHHLHISSVHVLPRNKCVSMQSRFWPVLHWGEYCAHTLTKALPIPLTHMNACLIRPMCVQLENTYSQTGEAPWLSRVSVSMSCLNDCSWSHTHSSHRPWAAVYITPTLSYSQPTPPPTECPRDASFTSFSTESKTKTTKIWSKSLHYKDYFLKQY